MSQSIFSSLALSAMLVSCIVMSACVSTSVDGLAIQEPGIGNSSIANSGNQQTGTAPTQLGAATTQPTTAPNAYAETGGVDPAARAAAIAEMRAKASQRGTVRTSPFATSTSQVKPKTAAEINEMKQQMQDAAQSNETQISDEEVLARQKSRAELARKAIRHYDDALQNIEN